MEPYWYLRAVRRFWWVIAASVVVAAVAAAVVTKATGGSTRPHTTYRATTSLYSSQGPLARDAYSDPNTVVGFLPAIPEKVKTRIGYPGPASDLLGMVEGTVDASTNFVQITGTSPDPDQAVAVSRGFAEELLRYLSEQRYQLNLETAADYQTQIQTFKAQINAATDPGTIANLQGQLEAKKLQYRSLTDPNVDPGFKILNPQTTAQPTDSAGFEAPRSLRGRLSIALVLGLLGGLGIALVIGRVDTTIRTKRQAEERFGLPVLAEIPVLPRKARLALVTSQEPGSRFAEGFRLLGAELVRGQSGRANGGGNGSRGNGRSAPHVLLVTSPGPGEGKTTVAANLAVALADMDRTVIVLSCDFRRPKIHDLFGVDQDPGLAEIVSEDGPALALDRALVSTKIEGVRLAPSGHVRTQPTELLNSSTFRAVIEEARGAADFVIIDTTPVLAVSDAAFVAPLTDAVLVVARSGRTTGEIAERTSELLGRLGCPVVGVALNRAADIVLPKGYRSYYERRPAWAAGASNGDGEGGRAEGAAPVDTPEQASSPDDGDSPTSRVTPEGGTV